MNLKGVPFEELEKAALYDETLPVYHFRYTANRLRQELRRTWRYKRRTALAVVHVDGLAELELNYGAEPLLPAVTAVAKVLNELTREDIDIVGSSGYGRFTLILPETSAQGAQVLAERIRKRVFDLEVQHRLQKLNMSCSIAILSCDGSVIDPVNLISQADVVAQELSVRGGNKVMFVTQ